MEEGAPRQWSGRLLAGRYRVGKELGRGGFGVVHEAVQEDLGRKVALKLLHARHADDPDYVRRLRREALTAASLDHPHIVQITDFQHAENEPPFLVMQHLAGETLQDVIRREGPMGHKRLLFIVNQVLSALRVAHRAGIVHRDIKPGNIYLTSIAGVRDVVKLLDFGIAKSFQASGGARTVVTRSGLIFGTVNFMAPEQVRGERLDGRCDLFALGVVMHYALTGKKPFARAHPIATLDAIVHAESESLAETLPQLDRRLSEVIERALQKKADDRFRNALEMRNALRPLLPDYNSEVIKQTAAAASNMFDVSSQLPTTAVAATMPPETLPASPSVDVTARDASTETTADFHDSERARDDESTTLVGDSLHLSGAAEMMRAEHEPTKVNLEAARQMAVASVEDAGETVGDDSLTLVRTDIDVQLPDAPMPAVPVITAKRSPPRTVLVIIVLLVAVAAAAAVYALL